MDIQNVIVTGAQAPVVILHCFSPEIVGVFHRAGTNRYPRLQPQLVQMVKNTEALLDLNARLNTVAKPVK